MTSSVMQDTFAPNQSNQTMNQSSSHHNNASRLMNLTSEINGEMNDTYTSGPNVQFAAANKTANQTVSIFCYFHMIIHIVVKN